MSKPIQDFKAGEMPVEVYATNEELGKAAAAHAAGILIDAVKKKGAARVIIATGNSQDTFIKAIGDHKQIPWEKITAFHMDEYVGMSPDHPASFRRWLRERVAERFSPKAMHYLDGDAPDVEAECRRYAGLLKEAPIDLVCLGIGENGHIAFNDPHVADFADPKFVKVVELDEACRKQQVGEGHFPTLTDVPTHAISLTVPALLYPDHLQVVVPEKRKAEAVRQTIHGPIATRCPASILRKVKKARLFLDKDSAALLGAS
jgi:glucosamine-6-phosphate deaminase